MTGRLGPLVQPGLLDRLVPPGPQGRLAELDRTALPDPLARPVLLKPLTRVGSFGVA